MRYLYALLALFAVTVTADARPAPVKNFVDNVRTHRTAVRDARTHATPQSASACSPVVMGVTSPVPAAFLPSTAPLSTGGCASGQCPAPTGRFFPRR